MRLIPWARERAIDPSGYSVRHTTRYEKVRVNCPASRDVEAQEQRVPGSW